LALGTTVLLTVASADGLVGCSLEVVVRQRLESTLCAQDLEGRMGTGWYLKARK